MVVFSSLVEIKLKPGKNSSEDIEGIIQCVSSYIKSTRKYGKLCYEDRDKAGDITMFFKTSHNSALLSCDDPDCLNLDFKRSAGKENEHMEFLLEMMKIENDLRGILLSTGSIKTIKRVPTIVRGRERWRYRISNVFDDSIMEGDETEVLFHKTSLYQDVTIVKSPSFGNLLLIDDVENLAETDISYTMTICGIGRGIEYQNKNVLILGGGDGACLHEIRKLSPKFVTMIEIDQAVIDGCKQYMRSVCGDSLDRMCGDNYKIIIEDCLIWFEKYANEERQFDIIISDLTDTPCYSSDGESTIWNFFRKVLNHCLKLLTPEGVILTHVGSVCNTVGISKFNNQLTKLDSKVTYKRIDELVPSFIEKWIFYQIRKIDQNI